MISADGKRMMEEIHTLATMSDTALKTGITRISWTREYAQGTDFIKTKMLEAGLEICEDKIGNICACLNGSNPKGSILSGSHLDTVRCGGAFDGVMGVICALEVARLLKNNVIKLKNNYKILAMVEEEGTSTGNVLTGSSYIRKCFENDMSGVEKLLPDKEIVQSYKEGEKVIVEEYPLLKKEKMVFIEVHNEQGPILEKSKKEIGIVNRIRGIINFEVNLKGISGHPGTVPMSARCDCSLAAYEICLNASDYVKKYYEEEATITFGKMNLWPGSSNCIPGEVTFSVDIRFGNRTIGEIIEKKVLELVETQQKKGIQATYKMHMKTAPTQLDDRLSEVIDNVCEQKNYERMKLDSGAGHDTINFAKICPSAMIFSPCKEGISHNVREYVEKKDIENVTNVLYETILRLDKEIR